MGDSIWWRINLHTNPEEKPASSLCSHQQESRTPRGEETSCFSQQPVYKVLTGSTETLNLPPRVSPVLSQGIA